jgi:hypothetical protein
MADRTPFAGLTRLDPADPLSTDGYRFQDGNVKLLDYFLRLLFNPNYDAHAALADPATDPTVTLDNAGGTIPSDLSITVAYTLMDADGGETAPAPLVLVDTQAGLAEPDDSPTLVLDHAVGTLLADTYTYAVTLVDGNGGETILGPPAILTIPPGSATNEIVVSGLAALTTTQAAAGWRLWRSIGAEDFHLIATGTDTDDTLTDDGSLTADCGVAPPSTTNTTRSTSVLHVTVPAGQPAGTAQFRIYAAIDGDFGQASLLGTYPAADLAAVKTYTELALLPGSPPEQSNTMPGFTAPGGGGGGGGGGGDINLASGDAVVWKDGDGNYIARLYAQGGGGSMEHVNDFADGNYNPAPATFDVAGGPGSSDLVAKAGTSVADFYGSFGFGEAQVGPGYIEGDFFIVTAATGWDKLGVGWGEIDRIGRGMFAVLDRASGELQLTWNDGSGVTVLASVPYTAIVDNSDPIIQMSRAKDSATGGWQVHVALTVAGVEDVTLDYTGVESAGWMLYDQLLLSWTDPAAFRVGRAVGGRDTGNSMYMEVYDADGNSSSKTLMTDAGTVDGASSSASAPTRQRAGIVLADGSTPGDTCQVNKTGVGVYDVTYWGALVEDGIIVVIPQPGDGVISNVSPIGFTITFAADTDFRFIAVSQP